jgi:hypothetical protein
MASPQDDFYGAAGQYMRERELSEPERVAYAKYLAQLLTEKSQAKGRSEKLLVQMRADQMDAAAKMADALAQVKRARISGNSDLLKSAVELAGHQMDFLADTSYKVASGEYAPLFLNAKQQEQQAKNGFAKHAYWSALAGDMLTKIPTVAGKSYVDAMLLLTQQGSRDWRKELASEGFNQNDLTWQNMEQLEREAEAQRKNRTNAQDYINSLLGDIKGDGSGSLSTEAKLPSEDAAFSGYLADVTEGFGVDKLKSMAADLRSTVDDTQMNETIDFLRKSLGASTSAPTNPNYVKTLQHPEFQAWAKDHGFVVGQVQTNPDGSFAGVTPGKDDYIAAKGYVYQMKRDPLARQRRWRASHDIVRLDWNEGAMGGEKPRDPNDVVKAEKFVVVDAENKPHVITRYFTGDMSKDLYLDSNGATKTLVQVREIGQIDKDSVKSFVLSDEKGLVHKSAIDAPDKLINYLMLDSGEADVRLAAESSELRKASAGSPQYAYGVDLGLAGGHGVRVIIDEEGKRRTIPASAKVTRLESLTPEHVNELDKLRANRVNRAVKNTDALTDAQKEQQLPDLLSRGPTLREKIEEAKAKDEAENKAANEQKNESRLPSTGNIVAVGDDLEITEDRSDKTAAPVGTKHAEDVRYTDAKSARQIEADPARMAREEEANTVGYWQAKADNAFTNQGVPAAAKLVDPESGLSGVPGSEARGRVLEGAPDSTGRSTMSTPMPNVEAALGPRSTQNMRDANTVSERAGGLPSPVLTRKQLSHNPGKFTASAKQEPEEVAPRSLRATAWGKARREERLQQLSNKVAEQLGIASWNATDAARKMEWEEKRRKETEENKYMRQAYDYGIAGQSKTSP